MDYTSSTKNGDGFNNKVNNLQLVTKSYKQRRVFVRNRSDSFLKNAGRSGWTKTYGGYANKKPVKQYNLKGKLVAHYKSIAEAVRTTGFDQKGISHTARELYKQWKVIAGSFPKNKCYQSVAFIINRNIYSLVIFFMRPPALLLLSPVASHTYTFSYLFITLSNTNYEAV